MSLEATIPSLKIQHLLFFFYLQRAANEHEVSQISYQKQRKKHYVVV